MKNKALNSLQYTGIVTLSQCINGKKIPVQKIYNKGGDSLFSFLTDCLIGDFDIAKLGRPTKIMLLQVDKERNVITVSGRTSGFIYLLNKPEKVYTNGNNIVRLSFIVPRDMVSGTDFNAIGLYSDNATIYDYDRYSAICLLDVNNNDLTISSILAVDWELILSNKTE